MLRMIVIEHLYNKYPKLPAEALHSALEMYAGPESSAQIARSLGLNHVTLWAPIVRFCPLPAASRVADHFYRAPRRSSARRRRKFL